MPLYDYKCSCGNVMERLYEPNKKPRRIKCSKCGKRAVSVIGRTAIRDNALTPWMRDLIGDPEHPGCIVDNDLLASGKIPRIETRRDFERVMRERGLSIVTAK